MKAPIAAAALIALAVASAVSVGGAAPARNGLIAFERVVANGTSAVYTMDARGRRLRRLTRHGPPLGLPVWAPDGSITYARPVDGRIVQIDPAAGRARLLPTSRRIRSTVERFTAAGRRAVYADGRAIWAVDLRSGRKTLIARTARAPVGVSLEDRRVAWAEGRRVFAIDLPESRLTMERTDPGRAPLAKEVS
jgi:hypothetical protein